VRGGFTQIGREAVTVPWHAIPQRSAPPRHAPGRDRNDPHRPPAAKITVAVRLSRNHAAAHHDPVTTGHGPAPNLSRRPSEGQTPDRVAAAWRQRAAAV